MICPKCGVWVEPGYHKCERKLTVAEMDAEIQRLDDGDVQKPFDRSAHMKEIWRKRKDG